MDIALWIIASLLAAFFLRAGIMKLTQPKEKLAATWEFAEDLSPGVIKTIGTLEVLAAIGLILPAVLDIAPIFVPLAALGLVLLMIGAVYTHFRRREAQMIAVNVALLGLAAFVAWGRIGPESFTG